MLRALVAEAARVSVALTVKVAVPAVVGVPDRAPVEDRVTPAGSVPEAMVHVYGPVAPGAVRVWLYAVPTVAPARDEVDTVTGTAALVTTMLRALVAEAARVSVALTVKVAVPAVVGVPDRAPVEDRVTPAGSVPEAMVHVYGPVPPVAVSVWLYAVPTVAPARDEVDTVTGTAALATTMLRALVAEAARVSVALTV